MKNSEFWMKYFFERLIVFNLNMHVADIFEEIGELGSFTFDLKEYKWVLTSRCFSWHFLTTGGRDCYIVPIRGAVCGIPQR